MSRIGVFVCGCGPNIAEKLDVEELVRYAGGLEEVDFSALHGLLCSAEGQAEMAEKIRAAGVERVVVAACSPREHEKTFMAVLEQAGLNPYLLQMVNIREQVSWVTSDRNDAMDKARALLRAGVRRVALHEPLEKKQLDCESTVLVLGAGVAGVESALVLAQKGRKVYLAEKLPCIGGWANRFEEVCPNMECGSCMLR